MADFSETFSARSTARSGRPGQAAARATAAPRLLQVSDPIEARTIRRLREELAEGRRLAVGSYLTSPRAVMCAAALAEESEVMWIDVRALQAAMFGIPARQLLTTEPLDGYLRRGMLAVDPRTDIDSATYEL